MKLYLVTIHTSQQTCNDGSIMALSSGIPDILIVVTVTISIFQLFKATQVILQYFPAWVQMPVLTKGFEVQRIVLLNV